MSEVADAARRLEQAATAYAEARAAYESAAMSADRSERVEAERSFRAAADRHAEALGVLVGARRSGVGPFERLLRDPTLQSDLEAVVLESIRAYAAAVPASAGVVVSMPIEGRLNVLTDAGAIWGKARFERVVPETAETLTAVAS